MIIVLEISQMKDIPLINGENVDTAYFTRHCVRDSFSRLQAIPHLLPSIT
jgi:hypothetical protein